MHNNMLSNEIKDKHAIDTSLAKCDYNFITTKMSQRKNDKIFYLLQKSLEKTRIGEAKQLISQYVDDKITLEDLVASLPLVRKHLYEKKDKTDEIKRNNSFHVFYPVYLNRHKGKNSQQPLLTFSCELTVDSFNIVKLYANKDILALIIATQSELEISDVKTQYRKQIDDISSAIDALRSSTNFVEMYEMVCQQFKQIMNTDLSCSVVADSWQFLDKATVSFEPADEVIDSYFRDELETLALQYNKNKILPETIGRMLGLSNHKPENIKAFNFSSHHIGSYQSDYPINNKQWQIMQLAKQSRLLCVDGPPGTGKTTLLKEMIAEEIVLKADTLIAIWDKDWKCLGDDYKNIYRSPLKGKNKHSVVISSTNNKAIDNIGLELLKEIEYFNDFASTIEHEEHNYMGMFCARLGKSKNVEDFYENFYANFRNYLNDAEISKKDARLICDEYGNIRDELSRLNDKISTIVMQKNKFPNISSHDELGREIQQLEISIDEIKEHINQLESQHAIKNQRKSLLESSIAESSKKKSEAQKQFQNMESHIRTLYADLQEYENISNTKRGLSFLFPKTRSLLKKYGSSQQIKDEIQNYRENSVQTQVHIEGFDVIISDATVEINKIGNELKTIKTQLTDIRSHLHHKNAQKEALATYYSVLHQFIKDDDFAGIDLISSNTYVLRNLPILIKLRHKLFVTAIKVFEAYIKLHKKPILQNLDLVLTKNEEYGLYSWCWQAQNLRKISEEDKFATVRDLWETFFLCFPVVTTTLHSFREKTFAFIPELFDVLMMDESGQIVPYYVVAPMYRAQRAVFVGDVYQIEPIKGVPLGLMEKKYQPILDDDIYKRFCIDTASAQSYASSASDYFEIIGEQTGGVILNEHRRCEPAIMAFSNSHIYQDVLVLIGKDDDNKLFGNNLVAFDVRGFKSKEHYNQAEIDACKKIVDMLVKQYGETVLDDIGVITPFSRQAQMLKQVIQGVDIGTVHVFQGAEKKFILFSCVLDNTAESTGLYQFIGGKGNLLNVAFSRAKKQFIFVGNFQAARDSDNYLKKAIDVIEHQGLLFSLFNLDPLKDNSFLLDKEIMSILVGDQPNNGVEEIDMYLRREIPEGIIAEPQLHNIILNDMLSMAKENVCIISPWIGSNVVTPKMLEVIRAKILDNVNIRISFGHKAVKCSLDDIDELVEKDIPWHKEDAAKTIRTLKELLGNALKYSPPSHVKLLLVDNKYLFIGSLNWLFNSGKTNQKEISCLITNPNTISYVSERFLTL